MSDLDRAIALAVDAHAGQLDKGGQPYILHPLRVMLAQHVEATRIAAVLHDVIEDSEKVGHGDILAMFGSDIHEAVFALTRQEGEDYFDYVRRAGSNTIAREVKIADLCDNLDKNRLVTDDANGPSRRRKYRQALAILEGRA